ncbi:MAG TPA: Omp28-related outer membrane protein [Ignavibacteriaceae bacterium]|nr:Omp28-related outer membrane protein [Ignavibacteriaceae bacterium]
MIRFLKLFSLAALLLQIIGCNTNPPDAPLNSLVDTGKVIVTSNVDSALIFADDIFTGNYSPDTLEVSAGEHSIRLEKENYISKSEIITVIKNEMVSINFDLEFVTVNKIVLLEDFANVSCNPCVISNKIIYSLTHYNNGLKVIAIKYPTNFPSPNDPFYLANTIDCSARMSYYNIFSAPTTVIDGIEKPISTDSNAVKQKISDRMMRAAQFRLTITDTLIGSSYSAHIKVDLLDNSNIDFNNLVIQTVVIEESIEFANPPGSNGETIFYDVMRAMLPSNQGELMTDLETTGSKEYTRQIMLSSQWQSEKIKTVVFIQDKNSKEVYQVEVSN